MEDMMSYTTAMDIVNGVTNSSNQVFISFDPAADEEAQKKAFNSMSMDGTSLMDCNGQIINVQDVIIMPVEVASEAGDTETCPRSILIDTENNVYTATSWGAYRSLTRLMAIKGSLHFEDGIQIKIAVVKTKKGKTINLLMA